VLRADELGAVSVGPTFAETARNVSFYTTRDRVVATWRGASRTHAVASWNTSRHASGRAASPNDGAATRFRCARSPSAYGASKTALHAPGLCFDAANALVWAYNATSRTVSCWASAAPRGDVWEGGASSAWSIALAPSPAAGAAEASTMVVAARREGRVARYALNERGAALVLGVAVDVAREDTSAVDVDTGVGAPWKERGTDAALGGLLAQLSGGGISSELSSLEGSAVSFLLFTVTFHANHAHNLTRSP
jgi:hypothetical protein